MSEFQRQRVEYLGAEVVLLQPPATPWTPSPFFGPPSHEIIYRYIRSARITDLHSISWHAGYSEREVSRAVSQLIKFGFIQEVGRLGYTKILAPIPRKGITEAPLICGGSSLFGLNPQPGQGWNTALTNGIKCSSHAYETARIVAWIVEMFRRARFICVPYLESLLRSSMHWVNPDRDEETVYFKTTIPDAWMILPQIGCCRLEVQLSRSNLSKLEQVINDMSHNDHILYVVPTADLARSIRKIEGKRTFTVIEHGKADQLAAWGNDFIAWQRAMPVFKNPLAENYGSEYFRALLLKDAGVFKPKAPPAAGSRPSPHSV